MNYKSEIEKYIPSSPQEESDKNIMLDYIERYDNVLLRENKIAHITSSGLVLNRSLDKMLMVHHNIYNTWSWTGGHADGEKNILKVAIKEAVEETGVSNISPLTESIVSLDILPVYGHMKKGKYVSAHLHLSISYVLIANEKDTLTVKEDENSGVRWVKLNDIGDFSNEPYLINIYNKIIKKAKEHSM